MSTVAEQRDLWLDRFLDRVDGSGGIDACWPWLGPVDAGGYGRTTSLWGRGTTAHRALWEAMHGPLPPRVWVLHRCDQPGCVNPTHLFVGLPGDNVRDMIRKGRAGWQRRALRDALPQPPPGQAWGRPEGPEEVEAV